MQLDRVPFHRPAIALSTADGEPEDSGTAATPSGVPLADRSWGDGGVVVPRKRIRARHLTLVGIVAFALLGQGQFRSQRSELPLVKTYSFFCPFPFG